MTYKLTEDDFELYDFIPEGGKIRVSIGDRYFETLEEAENFKKQILANQKLREFVEEEIKKATPEKEPSIWGRASHYGIQAETRLTVLQELQDLINEAEKDG